MNNVTPLRDDVSIDALVRVTLERGRVQFSIEQNQVGTPFIVPHDHAGEVLRLLIDAGYSLSNSHEWGGFVCSKP